MGWSILTVLVGLVLLFVVLRIPAVQRWLGHKAAAYLSKETGADIQLAGLSFTYNGSLALQGLFVPDEQGDTLLYSGQLEAGIFLLPLARGTISLKPLHWENVVAHIEQRQDSSFNFSYLLTPFVAAPDTTEEEAATPAEPLRLVLSAIDLANLRLHYHSKLSGDDYQLRLSRLQLDPDEVDLVKSRFSVAALKVDGLDVAMQLYPSQEAPRTTEEAGLPWIKLKNIALTNIRFALNQPGSQDLGTTLKKLTLDEATLDLTAEVMAIGRLQSDGLDLRVTTSPVRTSPAKPEAFVFEWPQWRYTLSELALTNYAIRMKESGAPETPAVFNPADMVLQLNELQLEELQGEKDQLGWQLLLIDLREKSGLALKTSVKLKGTTKELLVDAFDLKTDHSKIGASLKLEYNSVQALIDAPMQQHLMLQLKEGSLISLKDALFFAPELAKDTSIGPFIPWPLALAGNVSGNVDSMNFDDWKLSWGEATQLAFSATLVAPMDSLKRDIQLPNFQVNTSAHDLGLIARADGFRYPDQVQVQGSARVNVTSAMLQCDVQADEGAVTAAASLQGLETKQPQYELQMSARELDLGRYLKDSLLGKLGWVSGIQGQGFDPKTMVVTASVDFNQLQYQGYDYKALTVAAKGSNGIWEAAVEHDDQDLGLILQATATLDSIWPQYELRAQIDRADLKKLGFREEPFEMRFSLQANAEGTSDSLQTKLKVNDGLVVQNNTAFPLRQFELSAKMAPSNTELSLESDVISGAFSANTDLDALLNAVTKELRAQWKLDSASISDTTEQHIRAEGNFRLHDSPLLREVLLPGLTTLDSGQFSFKFDQNKHQLALVAQIKNAAYDGTSIRNFMVDFEADQGLKLEAGFDRLEQGPMDIHQTRLDMKVVDSVVFARFVVKDAAQMPVFRLQSQGGWQKGNRYISLDPDSTLFNRQKWQAHPNNRVQLGEQPEFTDFVLTHEEQSLRINATPLEIRLTAENFPLASIASILNTDTLLADGNLTGYIALLNKEDQQGLLSELRIQNLAILGQLLGELKMVSTMPAKKEYALTAGIQGPGLDLSLIGKYRMPATGTTLDLELDLKRFALDQLVVLSDSAIRAAKGDLLGKLAISGPLTKPVYVGELQFSNANMSIAAFNSSFGLGDKAIRFNEAGLVIDQFELTDENNQKLRLDGRILTGERAEAQLDLALKTQDFRLLNSTRADNALYYGVLRMNMDLKISGTPSKPVVNARARLNKGSKLSLIVPESQLDVVEREGVVIFSRVDPKTDTLIDVQEQQKSTFLGLRLSALLEVDRESELIMIMDERSGDQLSVSGEANLKYDIYTNGRSSMTGVYEIRRGQYDLSLYELVKRKFELVPGGRIVWNGDVTDATLDLQALYRIKTGASDLMSAQLSGADEGTRNRYRQELPFEVYMNIKGKLLQPDISFLLDMPEQQQSALDGNVYARIQQLNQQESDLNKQVFSLMVLNRFVPDGSGASNASGGASAMARSSVSQLLSSQLNSLSSQYVKGVDLNMALDSYTDYTSGQGQDRTQLNVNVRKSFMGDRLAVEVGRQVDVQGSSQASNDIIGDVSVEYRLSSDGAYRLRGFRRNQQEGLAEGPLVVTGMSLVLNREFNGFEELLRKKKETAAATDKKAEDKP